MTTIHNLGFPRMGARRELKFALESYWRGESSRAALQEQGARLRQRHWQEQAGLDWVPVGDFSFYDQVLDMSFTLGNLPERVQGFHGDALDNYFRVARGRSARTAEAHAGCCGGVAAGEMTKWFDTNYHYIVPEFNAATPFKLDAARLLAQLAEAQAQCVKAKPVIIGPVTYLAIGKAKDGSNKLGLLERLLPVYAELLDTLAGQGVEWVQIDEPILVTELDADWQHAFNTAYHQLKACRVKLLLATYFESVSDHAALLRDLPVAAAAGGDEQVARFKEAMDDDFNTPEAYSALFDLVREINRQKGEDMAVAAALGARLRELGAVLGILQQDPDAFLKGIEADEEVAEIERLIAERNQARADKNWAAADAARNRLTEMGIVLEDSAGKTSWRRA